MRSRVLVSFLLVLTAVGLIRGQGQAAKATISGTVSRADNGQPLKGARVNLQAGTRVQGTLIAGVGVDNRVADLVSAVATVQTDENGRFTFTGVDAGQYMISAERDGYVRTEYGQRTPTGSGVSVPITANQQLTVDLKMLRGSVVSGRVINADGEPAAQATVHAYTYRYANGQRSLAEVTNAQTNDLGEYRLYWLAPGEYFVSVSTSTNDGTAVGTVDITQTRGPRGGNAVRILSAISADRGPLVQALGGSASPPVFYPGTIDPDGAVPITVQASAEVRGMDFHLRPIPTANVSGRVVAPFPLNQGNTTAGFRGGRGAAVEGPAQFTMMTAPVQLTLNRIGNAGAALAGLIGLRLGATPVNPDGTFDIKGVAPGEYNLTATVRDANGKQFTGRIRVSVGSSDVPNLTLAVRPGVEVRGKIALEGTPSPQFTMSNLRVSLIAEDAALPGVVNLIAAGGGRGDAIRAFLPAGQSEMAEVAVDGSFTLPEVGAMQYRVRVAGLPQGAYVQTGRIDSVDALNAPFTVDNSGAQLQLQIGFSPGRVSGTIADQRGMPAAGVQAVLVPDEARRGRSDAYFAATTDQNGQFVFSHVPPGRYKLFAWEDVPAGAYQYPDFIRRYEERGQPISVTPNGAVTAETRLIPAN